MSGEAEVQDKVPAGSPSLYEKRDLPGLVRLVSQVGLLVVLAPLLLELEGMKHFVVALPYGIVLIFLFTPLHECVHRTAFKTRRINDVVANIVGFLIILPPRWFTAFHLAHHRFTQDPEKDPELASPKPTRFGGYLWVLSGFDYWYRAISGLLRRATGKAPESFLDKRTRPRAILEARMFLALYAFLIGGSVLLQTDVLLKLWVLPALLGMPFLRAYLFAEHWGCPTVKDFWENTRTIRTNGLVKWLAWNMPYHAEHHANPGVPFHALPDFAKDIEAETASKVRVFADGYVPFHQERIKALRTGEAGPV